MEIKQGDTVRVSDATPWIYTRNQYKGYDCKVEAVAGDDAIVSQLNVKFPIPTKYLVKVDAETKEATEEKKLGRITEETANKLSDMLEAYGNAVETIKDKSYWDAYTADLAKEVALKVANEYTEPKETAEYAVKVAKAVVEGLKRK